MKKTLFISIFALVSCQHQQDVISVAENATPPHERMDDYMVENMPQNTERNEDSTFFTILLSTDTDFIQIIPPKDSDFELPEDAERVQLSRQEDFNSDGKADLLLDLGACGTGGCVYGVFLQHHDNYYSLAFLSYMKNVECKRDRNKYWMFTSTEELEPYNPYHLQITDYYYNPHTNYYDIDSTYEYHDDTYDE